MINTVLKQTILKIVYDENMNLYVSKIDIVASVISPCTTNIPPHNNINGSLKFLNVCVPIPYNTFIFASFISFL